MAAHVQGDFLLRQINAFFASLAQWLDPKGRSPIPKEEFESAWGASFGITLEKSLSFTQEEWQSWLASRPWTSSQCDALIEALFQMEQSSDRHRHGIVQLILAANRHFDTASMLRLQWQQSLQRANPDKPQS